jgi:hypothetical protein
MAAKGLPVESTDRFRIPVDTVLERTVDIIVANAYKIKQTTKKKMDLTDSEWLAELCLNDMIEPSRIFPKEDRDELREALMGELEVSSIILIRQSLQIII